jgi:uncharacterized protein (TIGR02099 family)
MKTLGKWLLRALLLLFVLLVFATTCVYAIRTWLLPDLTVLQPRIETELSKRLKQPVHLRGISAAWNWASVDIASQYVSIGPELKPQLALTNAKVRIMLHPLLWGELQTEYLTVDKAAVNLTQAGPVNKPQWLAAGFDLSQPSDGSGMRWLLKQTALKLDTLTLTVRDDAQHWVPEKQTQVVLSEIEWTNQQTNHHLKARFAPNYQDTRLGGDAQLDINFTHAWLKDLANPKHWTGKATLVLPDARVAASTAWVVQLLNPDQQQAIWPAWQQWAQQAISQARLSASSTIVFKQGALSGFGELKMSGLPRQSADALTPVSWSWSSNNDSSQASQTVQSQTVQINSPQLTLAPLSAFMQTMPLSPQLASALTQAQPVGVLSGLDLKADFSTQQLSHLTFNAQAKRLGMTSVDWKGTKGIINVPTMAGISGSVQVDYTPEQTLTSIHVDATHAYAELPRLLSQPHIDIDQINGQIDVTLNHQETKVKLTKLRLNNVDLAGQLSGEYRIPTRQRIEDRSLGVVQLSGGFERVDLAQLHRYMPQTMSDKARQWLHHTIEQGQARDVTLTLNGDLMRFPFLPETALAGERFDLHANISKAVLNFNLLPSEPSSSTLPVAKQWPLIEDVSGELRLQGLSLTLLNMDGSLKSSQPAIPPVPVRMPKLTINSLTAPVVVFKTRASAPAISILDLVLNSPLSQLLGDQLAVLKTSGTVSAQADLTLDIAHPERNLTQGVLDVEQASLQISKELPPLERLNARLKFNQTHLQVEQATAQWLGGDVLVTGGLDTQDPLQILRVQGTAQLDVIKQYSPNAMAQALLSHAAGSVDYNLALNALPEGINWQLSADLKDTALQWPGLFDKAQGVSLPFSLTRKPTQRNVGASIHSSSISQEAWSVTLGATVLGPFQAIIERELMGTDWRIQRGTVALGALAELNMPDQGLGVHIATPTVNLDRLRADIAALPWASVINQSSNEVTLTTSQAKQNQAIVQTNDAVPAWMPSVLVLQVDDLTLFNRRFFNIVGAATRMSGSHEFAHNWNVNLKAKGINGYLQWIDTSQNKGFGKGQLLVKLTELSIPASEIQSTSQALLDIAPEQVPNIDVSIQSFTLGDKALGEVTINANHTIDGVVGKGWNINSFSLKQPHAQLMAKGQWTHASDAQYGQVQLDIDLNTNNLGETLDQLNYGKIIADTAGKLTGKLQWRGSPFKLDLPSLSGVLKADFEKGQFLKIDTGAARLLSLFSLQNLPRRLTLDFKDTFGTGFAFDTISATANMSNGLLKTDDFLMKSSLAQVSATGEVSLTQETQSLMFTVKPDVNAGSVSLLYMAINPPLGLATLAFQWLLREPINKALTIDYRISGPWIKPDIQQVKREFR